MEEDVRRNHQQAVPYPPLAVQGPGSLLPTTLRFRLCSPVESLWVDGLEIAPLLGPCPPTGIL